MSLPVGRPTIVYHRGFGAYYHGAPEVQTTYVPPESRNVAGNTTGGLMQDQYGGGIGYPFVVTSDLLINRARTKQTDVQQMANYKAVDLGLKPPTYYR